MNECTDAAYREQTIEQLDTIRCGDIVRIPYDERMVAMLKDDKYAHYNELRDAVRKAISTQYRDIIAKKHDKQYVLKYGLEHGARWERWLDYMMEHIIISPEIPMTPIPLREISAEIHKDLTCTDGVIMGVDVQQAIVQSVQVVHEGRRQWIDADLYNAKANGPIYDQRMIDVQYVMIEDIEDAVHARRVYCRIRRPHVGQLKHGDRVRVYGYYTTRDDEGARRKVKNTFLDCTLVKRLPPKSEATLSEADLAAMRKLAHDDPDTYLDQITASVAPDITGNRPQKIMVLLAAIKANMAGGSRDNLHILLMDSPGTGKSALIKWIADVLPKSTYVDGPNATAQGLLYGQEDFAGRKILHAGTALRHNVIMIDEIDKMPIADRQKIYSAIEQQIASYHKVPYSINTHMDLSMIACANPANESWNEDATIMENTKSVESAFISRCIVTRMERHDNVDSLVDSLTDKTKANNAPYTQEQIAGIVHHCTTLTPEYTDDSRAKLKIYLNNFQNITQSHAQDLPIEIRQNIDMVRIVSATAKLLHRETVDEDSVRVGYDTYMACLSAIGMNTEHETKQITLKTKDMSKDTLVFHLMDMAGGTIGHSQLLQEMVDTNKWTHDEAQRYLAKLQHTGMIIEPTLGTYARP